MDLEELEVNCYSGHTYAERPDSFRWKGVDYRVEKIEEAWLEPGERHFQLLTDEKKKFHLYYEERENRWYIIQAFH
jgi:hypothetical protein